jgi:hypothetical protein
MKGVFSVIKRRQAGNRFSLLRHSGLVRIPPPPKIGKTAQSELIRVTPFFY